MNVRVLIVEDEFLIGLEISGQLADAGYAVVGPAPSVADALKLVSSPGCDMALLDVNLGSESSAPVAAALKARAIPFVVLSGYRERSLAGDFNGAEILGKPFRSADLLVACKRCIEGTADPR
ncbi:response regulator [Methylocystis sp. IM3]|uniref:response regulator n=1 Tax=unclassified Methylocystis TaxID=2625913 RepID=UPI000FB9363D|nr:MAG: response regulator [Hyphomicrobiales bacterium]